jgi:hypothetical protein
MPTPEAPVIETHDTAPPGSEASIKSMADRFRSLVAPSAPDPAAPATPPADPGKGKETQPPAPAATPDPKADKAPDKAPEDFTNAPITRENFKRLSQSNHEFREQVEKAKKEHGEALARSKALEEELAKTKAALPPNLEEVQKSLADAKRHADENKQLTEQLETISLERSPRFQNWWNTETAKHIKLAQQYVQKEHREEFGKLLLAAPSPERDSRIDELLEPLSNTGKRIATGAVEAMEVLRLQREEALTNGSARYKELVAHEKAEAEKEAQAIEQRKEQLTQKALGKAKGYTAFQPSGDTAADAEIPQREAFVRAAINGKLDEEVMLALPAISVEYLHLTEKVIPALRDEVKKQAELIKQLQGASPSPSGGGRNQSPAAGKDKGDDKDGNAFMRRVMALTSGNK